MFLGLVSLAVRLPFSENLKQFCGAGAEESKLNYLLEPEPKWWNIHVGAGAVIRIYGSAEPKEIFTALQHCLKVRISPFGYCYKKPLSFFYKKGDQCHFLKKTTKSHVHFSTNKRPRPPLQQPIRELSLLSVQEMIVAEGFLLVRSRLMHLSRERAQQFYAEHRLQKSVQKLQKFQR